MGGGGEDRSSIKINEFFSSLGNLLESKSNMHWHNCYLSKYVTENLCPLGLRIQLFPHFKILSDDFKRKWKQTLTICSVNMMGLLIEHYQSEMSALDTEIQTLLLNSNHLQASTCFQEKEAVLNDCLDKFKREIISSKELKFLRDKKAFNLGKAYRWSKSTSRKPFINLRRRNDNGPVNDGNI